MQAILLLIFCKINFAAIFEEQPSLQKEKIVYVGDEPSKLACIQKSLFYRADAVYDGQKCTCVKKDESGEDNVRIKGTAYSLVGDKNLKKIESTDSCESIAQYNPTASSGLYTIKARRKTVKVYCDIRNLKTVDGETIEGGWMLVANVSLKKTPTDDEARHITNAISSQIIELKNAATKNFLFNIVHINKFLTQFREIRFYCKRARTVHLIANQFAI